MSISINPLQTAIQGLADQAIKRLLAGGIAPNDPRPSKSAVTPSIIAGLRQLADGHGFTQQHPLTLAVDELHTIIELLSLVFSKQSAVSVHGGYILEKIDLSMGLRVAVSIFNRTALPTFPKALPPATPCCHINTAGPFSVHLQVDSRRFSSYVAGCWPLLLGAAGGEMTSALHVDLKLWDAPRTLANIYQTNDALGNAWKTARPRMATDMFLHNPAQRLLVESKIALPPLPASETEGCRIAVFDRWILDAITQIRLIGRGLPGFAALKPGTPPALSTVGMAQKVVNIYLKYHVCWYAGGICDPATGAFAANPPSASVAPYLCAFHCPIDSILLKKIGACSLGKWMRDRGYMAKNFYLRQFDGNYRPWTKLDCLGTYYRFQQLLRLLAMRTWPPGCACSQLGGEGIGGGPWNPGFPGYDGVPFGGDLDWDLKLDDDLSRAIDATIAEIGNKARDSRPPSADPQLQRMRLRTTPDHPTTPSVAHDSASKIRPIWVKPQQSGFKSLKWHCADRWNAGALSFENRCPEGTCYVNSVCNHRGGDLSLAEQIALNGFNFQGPGFNPAPEHGGVAGYGGGSGYLGYRTFPNEVAARDYLRGVGVPLEDCLCDSRSPENDDF